MKNTIMRFLFWVLWPLIWLYAPLRTRARVLVRYKDTYLVVRPYFGSGVWQLPGGGIKFGETALAAAKRELYEEVHVSPEDMQELCEPRTYKENGLLLRYVLFGASCTTKPSITKNSEIAAYAWLTKQELLASPTAQHVREVLAKTK
jgi:8-oxo-dGTP pyrophosphatase MutT (NUDIX family)